MTPKTSGLPVRFAVETPTVPGAVAVIRLTHTNAGTSPSPAHIGFEPPQIGGLGLRDVFGIDRALIARPDAQTLLVMPHGGGAVVRAILDRLIGHGAAPSDAAGESEADPEPGDADAIERRMLAALAAAASPLAVDLLLDQPARWARAVAMPDEIDTADGRVLGRLIHPPTVVAIGRPNIGKSSLLNALGGRSLALAFDRPGTTRDAVGALIDASGLVVRWIDTPGLPEFGAASDALADEHALVRRAVVGADLIVLCQDAHAEPTDLVDLPSGIPVLHVVTRADRPGDALGATASGVLLTSAATGIGLAEVVAAVRATLVPEATLNDPRPWRFWASLPPERA